MLKGHKKEFDRDLLYFHNQVVKQMNHKNQKIAHDPSQQ